MDEPKKDRRTSPFPLGGIGLLIMLAGTGLPGWVAELGGNGRLWALAGRLIFLAGLGLVTAAAVLWYQQAQAPEELESELDGGPDPDQDSVSAEP